MDLSKFSSKAQGLLGKMSEVKQEISEKATEATQKASQSISTKSTEIKEKVAAFKLEDIINNLKIYEKHFSESELWNKVTKIGKSFLYYNVNLKEFNAKKLKTIGNSFLNSVFN